MNASQPGIVYNSTAVSYLLGLACVCNDPVPEADAGEVVIYYGGWSLQELRESPVIREQNEMWDQDWYDKYAWVNEKFPAGVYRLRIPAPKSHYGTFADEVQLLPSGQKPAPVVLVATALLAHRLQTGEDLLNGSWTRCRDRIGESSRVLLYWSAGELFVSAYLDDDRSAIVCLSSVRSS